jgi:outer membrane protein assembly factor BamB
MLRHFTIALMPPNNCEPRPDSPRVAKVISTLMLLAVVSVPQVHAADEAWWPQWRGAERNGHVAGPAWPDRLDEDHLQRSWHVEMGPSYSGPIVSGERVFTTETRAQTYEVAIALDRQTGRELWRAEWEGAMRVPFFARSNGDWIRATPATDGESLYVAGMRDVLVCLDVQNGRERWRFDFVDRLGAPLPDFGFVSSPLVHGDSVYVQAGASLVRLNKGTGELVWRTLEDRGGMWGSAFSSPVIAELAGQQQLLVQTRQQLAGVDLADGRVLWEHVIEAFRGMNILTPVHHEDMLFTSAYGGRTVGLLVSREEDDAFTVSPAWQHKAQGYMNTPVIIDGVAYIHLRSQRAMAIDVNSGRERWTSDRRFGKYCSFVAQGDRILALEERGELILLRANPERFEVIDERRLTEGETWAHLAVVGDQVFVRELNALTAYRWANP